MEIKSFKTLEDADDIDLDAEVGTQFSLTDVSTVTIIDPFDEYVACLKECFDFDALKEFVKRDDFSVLFDGMHGAGGPFARRVLLEELGLPEVCVCVCLCDHCTLVSGFLSMLLVTSRSLLCCDVTHFQILGNAILIRT